MASPPQSVTATVKLSIWGTPVELDITVPTGPVPVDALLPVFQAFTDAVVECSIDNLSRQGKTVSCRSGCGACCRQMVPLSEAEARHIGEVVEALPEPRRAEVRARFAEARRRLEESGVLAKLLDRDGWVPGENFAVGNAYFALRIPCPFLVDESCSIHPERPLACREYLVTSPPEYCADPTSEKVEGVKMSADLWASITQLEGGVPGSDNLRWVPLILAPEWAEAHPDGPAPRPAPAWVQEFLLRLSGKPGGGPLSSSPSGMGR